MVSGVNAVSVFHQRRWLLKVMNSIITVSRAAFRWAQASKLMAREHMNQLRLIQFTFRVRKALMSSERQFVVLPLSSLSVVFLSCLSLCTPLSHFLYRIAKKHINHWSVQLIFPPTCQEKEREHHRPYPGSVYLCYYYRINGEASLSFYVFTEISILCKKRQRMRCLSVCLWEKRKLSKSPSLSLTSCLRHLHRYVIDFASWGLLSLCTDNY